MFDLVDPVLSVAAMLSVQNPVVRLTDADAGLAEVRALSLLALNAFKVLTCVSSVIIWRMLLAPTHF